MAALAARFHMSPRHFGRVFCQQVGMSPGRYVERIRLETARRRLEESDQSVEAVAIVKGWVAPLREGLGEFVVQATVSA